MFHLSLLFTFSAAYRSLDPKYGGCENSKLRSVFAAEKVGGCQEPRGRSGSRELQVSAYNSPG